MDSTLKHHQRTDQARAEVERYRAGEPTRGPLLWAADFWETPAEALEALRSGAWQPVPCEFCFGSARRPPKISAKDPCHLCLGTGLSWSGRHAELAAYAGCESLRPKISGYVWSVGDNYPLPEWLSYLPDWGTVPPVVAALGVVREWLFEIGPGDPNRTLAAWNVCKDALDAVERYVYSPTEENKEAIDVIFRGSLERRTARPVSGLMAYVVAIMIGDSVEWAMRNHNPVGRSVRDGLPEPQAASAARTEVRRWSLAGLMGTS